MFWVLQLFLSHSFAYCIGKKLAHNSSPSCFQGKPCEIKNPRSRNNCSLKSRLSVSPTGPDSAVFREDFCMTARCKEKVFNECCNQAVHSRFDAMANVNWYGLKCQFYRFVPSALSPLQSVLDVNTS